MNSVLVTGASGFVGRHLCMALSKRNIQVVGTARDIRYATDYCKIAATGDIGGDTDWRPVLQGISTVVHLAARVHVMGREENQADDAYMEVNLHGTMNLAEQAVASGVERFLYLSTVKVNGESTRGFRFAADDVPSPEGAYARSKWAAEQALWDIASATGLKVIVIRPPLIYGAGAKGNLQRLMSVIEKGVPLPLGAVRNSRSLLNVDNLTDFIATCLTHRDAWGQTFMLSDGRDLSTPELIEKLADSMKTRVRMVPVPVGLLRVVGRLTGKEAMIERLCSDLQVDIGKNRDLLGWTPPFEVEQGLLQMARSRGM